jgi:F-type H+-transporting ATPase subunit a
LEHESVLYRPVNRLLISLFGPPPVEKMSPGAAAFWFPDGKEAWIPDPALMTVVLLLLFVVFFPLAARRFRREHPGGLQNFLEMIVEAFRSLLADIIGHDGKKYLPMVGTLGVYIFVANMFGLLFFLTPPTGVLATTLALASLSFVYFNVQGIRELGLFGYLRHFLGPVLWLAPLMFVIEMIGNFARILSLSLRLFMNIYGEHTATGVFASLEPIIVPWPLMVLGVFTALLQSFIFVTLTSVYISLGTAREEH